jgi:two-component system OmpR family sensor kinase
VSDLEPVDTTDLPQEIRPLVDELNLLFERLAQSFEAQSRFVADAAHELRTPLAALTLQLDALQRADTAAARERAQARLVTGMTRASRMVEQMLQLARVQAGTAPPGPARSVDLAELAREAVTEGQAAAQARGIDLGLAQAESGTLSGDAQALRVLIANLVDNAMNHCPAGGGVDLRVRRQHACGADPDRLELIVDDSGPGIAPTDRPRVFERFVRLPGTDTPGSGLGLSIVKSIADLHQAQVRLETAPERNGLRVRVSFPVERSA